mgnify:CR=1 FL=1
MHMSMMVVADGRCVTLPISIDCWFIVGMIVTVFVAVMPKMRSVVRCVFQCIANTHRCRIGSVQREHDGKKKNEASAHGGRVYRRTDGMSIFRIASSKI